MRWNLREFQHSLHPSLLTLDNEEAYITVGSEVPFVTGSYTNTGVGNGAQNPFQTIERESVGVT
ncbi:MAG: hypothetical protein CM15mP74_02020 [Halieaceae bacterium]|nr:MAG: hypothetical protein CM15mP74_02020 [Halieaceae bacterium]